MKLPSSQNLLYAYGVKKPKPSSTWLRFFLSLGLGMLAWAFPPWGSITSFLILAVLFRINALSIPSFFLGLKGLWIIILFPFTSLIGLFDVLTAGESTARSLTVLALFMSSHLLSSCTTMEEIRAMGSRLFSLLGHLAARRLGLIMAMTLAFLPWIFRESRAIKDAHSLRQPGRNRVATLRLYGVPLLLRLFQKVRACGDALMLRDQDSW